MAYMRKKANLITSNLCLATSQKDKIKVSYPHYRMVLKQEQASDEAMDIVIRPISFF